MLIQYCMADHPVTRERLAELFDDWFTGKLSSSPDFLSASSEETPLPEPPVNMPTKGKRKNTARKHTGKTGKGPKESEKKTNRNRTPTPTPLPNREHY